MGMVADQASRHTAVKDSEPPAWAGGSRIRGAELTPRAITSDGRAVVETGVTVRASFARQATHGPAGQHGDPGVRVGDRA
jgi:hypothetical protein